MRLYYEEFPAGLLPLNTLFARDTRSLRWDFSDTASAAFLAHDGKGRIMAVINFDAIGRHRYGTRLVQLYVAWVHPSLRGRGVVTQLLGLLVGKYRPSKFWAKAVTRNGVRMLRGLARRYPLLNVVNGDVRVLG